MESRQVIGMEGLVQKAYFSDNVVKKRSHYHDCHQIILIVKGEVQLCVNNAKYIACAGSVMIFSRYENHSITVLSEQYERYVLHIHPKASGVESRVYALLSNRPEGFCNAVDVSDTCALFEQLFCRIIEEHGSGDALSADMQQLLVNQLLIMIYRQLPERLYFNEMIYAIQRRFENQCSEQYTLDGLAEEYTISPSSLSHQFKAHTGASVMGYLLSCRMAAAKKYLTQTDMDIASIVEKCGFSDSSNFSRAFKRANGMSPRDFRKKYKAR